jgi:hypothetical protein
MWSMAAAVLLWVAVCAGAVILALQRFRRELEPARRSFDLLNRDIVVAVRHTSRDTGRAEASRRLLLRHGSVRAPR